MKLAPRFEAMASTTYSCQRKLCRRRVPKSATCRSGNAAQALDLAPELCLGARIKNVKSEFAQTLEAARAFSVHR